MRPLRKGLQDLAGSTSWGQTGASCPLPSIHTAWLSGGELHLWVLCTTMVCYPQRDFTMRDKRAICHPWYLLKRLRWPTHIIVFSLLHSPAVSWGSGYWSAGNAVPPLWCELKLSKHWPWWGVFWCNWTEKHQELDSDPIKSQFGQWYN